MGKWLSQSPMFPTTARAPDHTGTVRAGATQSTQPSHLTAHAPRLEIRRMCRGRLNPILRYLPGTGYNHSCTLLYCVHPGQFPPTELAALRTVRREFRTGTKLWAHWVRPVLASALRCPLDTQSDPD